MTRAPRGAIPQVLGVDHTAHDGGLGRRLAVTALLLALGAGGVTDLLLDDATSGFHVAFELALLAGALGGIAWLWIEWARARGALVASRADAARQAADRDAWRARAEVLLRGLGAAIDAQLARWQLTNAERETALLLLKGYGHKEIAALLGKSERTVRQQSVAVYRKSGLAGRAELAAFFLEDLLLPSATVGPGREEAPR
jgi:DNA-binding CsgD family transcriptional regulator